MSIFLSILFTIINHPIIMVATIIIQALIICIIIAFNILTSWFSFILFLVFIGGLIVLFIYIARLASNEIFKFEISLEELLPKLIIFTTFLRLIILNLNQQNTKYIAYSPKILIFKLYSLENFTLIISCFFYLLLALIIIVSIIKIKEGPLRSLK